MTRANLIGMLLLAAAPLAAQQPPVQQAPVCGAPAAAAPAPHDMTPPGGCPMMQHGSCLMMQDGRHSPGHGAMGNAQGEGWVEPALAPINDALTFCPSRMLDQKDALELTPQQEVRLEALLASAQRAIEVAQSEAEQQSEALSVALRLGKPDVREVERRFRALHAALGSAHQVRLRTSIQARAVLTDEQREKVVGQFAAAGGCGHTRGQ